MSKNEPCLAINSNSIDCEAVLAGVLKQVFLIVHGKKIVAHRTAEDRMIAGQFVLSTFEKRQNKDGKRVYSKP